MKENRFRLSFPKDEKNHNWLPLLLNAYAIMDEGVSKDIEKREKSGEKLACRCGCSNCCETHCDIPIYPIEIVGVYWYVIEKVKEPVRSEIKNSLIKHKNNDPCPFLIRKTCSIYLMRPLACRQFNVFGEPCRAGEDAFYTRPDDVMKPSEHYLGRALYETTPFYGIFHEQERVEFINSGRLNRLVRILQHYPWIELARRLDQKIFE